MKLTKPPLQPQSNSVLERFERSMAMDHDKWRDGIGYDLDILKTATTEERLAIENLILRRGVNDWRDVEALAALSSPRARAALRQAIKSANHRLAVSVVSYAPQVLSKLERTNTLVTALTCPRAYQGLSQTLLEVEEFHPPEVAEALLRGVLKCDGETAVHYAAMLMFIHGQAKEAFDWELRPFFLQFNTEDSSERKALYTELCARIGVDPKRRGRRSPQQ